jgi:hypothetical protein
VTEGGIPVHEETGRCCGALAVLLDRLSPMWFACSHLPRTVLRQRLKRVTAHIGNANLGNDEVECWFKADRRPNLAVAGGRGPSEKMKR